MGILDRPAAGLAWLGRRGTNAVAISILLGIVLPPLGALIRPFFPETVFLLLCLAFLRVDPGARYPPHHHSGGEDCYVISGEIIVAGQRLHAGDFHRAEPDSDHGVLASDTGAEVLLVVSAADYH